MDEAPGSLKKLLELAAHDEASGLGDAPWPPHFKKMKGEATRVAPSRARTASIKKPSQKKTKEKPTKSKNEKNKASPSFCDVIGHGGDDNVLHTVRRIVRLGGDHQGFFPVAANRIPEYTVATKMLMILHASAPEFLMLHECLLALHRYRPARTQTTNASLRVHRRLSARNIVRLASLTIVSACQDIPVLQPEQPPVVTRYVTGDAMKRLSATGQILLDGPIPYPYAQISEETARRLADGYRKIFIPQISNVLEKDRGGKLDLTRLHVCDRVFYGEPAVEALPPSEVGGVRRAFGPYWLVSLCGRTGVPQVSVAVSSLATEVNFDGRTFSFPTEGGMFFFSVGIPLRYAGGLPGSPEAAIRAVAEQANAQIAAVPRLIIIPRVAPQLAVWEMILDHPVSVRSRKNGQTQTVAVLFYKGDDVIGHAGVYLLKEGSTSNYQYPSVIHSADPRSPPSVVLRTIPFRLGLGSELEEVEVVKQ